LEQKNRPSTVRLGTRGSKLALAQTEIAASALREAAQEPIEIEVVRITTKGDTVTDRPFELIGPKGVFAAELQRALVDGEIDLAVHSLKDLPADEPDGLDILAVCKRSDPHDVLVSRDGHTLSLLPPGSIVGTSSSRRQALVAMIRPDLHTAPLRGNVDTRLEKVRRGDVDAALLAAAGLIRLGLADEITERLDPQRFVPPPGQGAIAIEGRLDRDDLAWVARADHAATRVCVEAERMFMRIVEGGCEVPLGAWARLEEDDVIVCEGFLASADGSAFVRETARGDRPAEVGAELARRIMAAGGAELAQRSR
jgi:hydroxymethylbilane synthase